MKAKPAHPRALTRRNVLSLLASTPLLAGAANAAVAVPRHPGVRPAEAPSPSYRHLIGVL